MEKLEHGILSKHNLRVQKGELVHHGHEMHEKHIAGRKLPRSGTELKVAHKGLLDRKHIHEHFND
jgi:hypothetical protein